MPFNFLHLDASIRQLMIAELELDITNGTLYLSKRFDDLGQACYPGLIREATENHDEVWLASRLQQWGCFNNLEATRRGAKPVNSDAPVTLADGEFNKFYMRALCVRAIREGIPSVVAYRAKAVLEPRPDSEAIIGKSYSPELLLSDLRIFPVGPTGVGLCRPNSGLSVKLHS